MTIMCSFYWKPLNFLIDPVYEPLRHLFCINEVNDFNNVILKTLVNNYLKSMLRIITFSLSVTRQMPNLL